MMRALTVSAAAFCLCSASNEEAQMTADAFLEVGSHRHLQAVMMNMTTERALRSLPSPLPQQLEGAVQLVQLGTKHAHHTAEPQTAFLQANEFKSKVFAHFKSQGGTMQDPNSARPMLNSMAEASARKMDIAQLTCAESSEKGAKTTEDTRQDISEYNAQGAATRAHVLLAETNIATIQDKLPKLNEALDLHKHKCEQDLAALKTQVELVEQDATTLQSVVQMTQCAATTSLLQCKHPRRHTFIMIDHHATAMKASELKSRRAKRALQKALEDTYHTGRDAGEREVPVFLEVASHHRHGRRAAVRHLRAHHHKSHSHHHRSGHHATHKHHSHRVHHKSVHHTHTALLMEHQSPPNAPNSTNTTDVPQNAAQMRRKCSAVENPNCDTMREKFLLMQTGVTDKKEDLEDQIVKLESGCEATRVNYEAQMDDFQTRLKDQQAMLAEATKVVVETEEQTRLKGRQLAQLELENKRAMLACKRNLDGLAAEVCSVKQIRQELYKMNMDRTFIQDCEVSAWTPQECSVSCAGGSQQMTRTVVIPSQLGVACPPLMMERRCNEQACPIDCELESWGGWSACSAGCGGGIKQRVRAVGIQAEHNGKPCGATSESSSCNVDACDQDCKLSPWAEWSACTKACDGGFHIRKRGIATKIVGGGMCPADESAKRLQYKRCNVHTCEPTHGETLECHAKLDVVIALDGSASLGDDGWEAMKEAGASLVRAFKTDGNKAQVGLILFSGPDNWNDYQRCTSGTGEDVDMFSTCNIIWVSHFTTNTEELAGNIGNLVWPKSTSLTSAALATAESELRSGRRDAQAVVIVLTDGAPMNRRKTFQAAESLRNKARLVWVPITSYAPLSDIKEWASRPVADNVAAMSDFPALNEPANINRIISDACPIVE